MKAEALTLPVGTTYTTWSNWAYYFTQNGTARVGHVFTSGSGTVLAGYYNTSSCRGTNLVYTMTIFENTLSDSPSHTSYGCGRWPASTVYRAIPEAKSTTSSIPVATTTPATPASSTAVPTPTSAETSPSASGDPSPAPASSQAWIAGAVAGPIVGCILVGLLVWWIMRRRMKKAAATVPAPLPAAEQARHVSSTYGQYQPVSHWQASSPPPPPQQDRIPPGYGWGTQHKPTSPPPVSGASPESLQELSNVPGNHDHAGVVYELHNGK
ncbi:hypothetical protein PG994_001378 [Apiospora phragmitis]|uniref:Uncharacterized protein n=1 Tax=Apiospora phragmitis TaxID=2905665 RepID=A0ABR1WTD4_9PEZI